MVETKKNEDLWQTRRWLNRAWRQEREINSLMGLKAETRERLTGMTAAPDAVRVDGGRDVHRFDGLVELNDAIDAAINRQLAIKAEIVAAIEAVEDGRFQAVLLCRYTRFFSWERIAVELHYSYRQTLRLHNAALRAIKNVIECHIAAGVK